MNWRALFLTTTLLMVAFLTTPAFPADDSTTSKSVPHFPEQNPSLGKRQPSQETRILKPFTARYKADIKGLPFGGSGERSLQQNSDGSWTLSFRADAAFLGLKETSRFTLKDQSLVSEEYTYARTGIGGKPLRRARFDWKKKVVNWQQEDLNWSMDLPSGAIDNLGYQLQLRMDLTKGKKQVFSYHIADDDEVYQREFIIEGNEVLDTDAGKLETVRIKVKRDTDKRATWIWLARNWDYFLVKLLQKEGGTEYTVEIQEATVDGKPLTSKQEPEKTKPTK
ncbi:MAG: DUF3108 domain-containing protein [Endozoicomonas sp.]